MMGSSVKIILEPPVPCIPILTSRLLFLVRDKMIDYDNAIMHMMMIVYLSSIDLTLLRNEQKQTTQRIL